MEAIAARIATAKVAVEILKNRKEQLLREARSIFETTELAQAAIDETEERIARLEASEAQ